MVSCLADRPYKIDAEYIENVHSINNIWPLGMDHMAIPHINYMLRQLL